MTVSIFIFLIILVIGGWMLIGKIGDATKSLAETSQTNEKVAESNLQVVDRLTILLNENPDLFKKNGIVSGLVPAS
jgi:hypothetical protein